MEAGAIRELDQPGSRLGSADFHIREGHVGICRVGILLIPTPWPGYQQTPWDGFGRNIRDKPLIFSLFWIFLGAVEH